MAQLDQPGSVETARKLAAHPEVPIAQQSYYSALAMELEHDGQALQTPLLIRYCEVESEDQVSSALNQLENVVANEDDNEGQAKAYFAQMVGDELPAKSVYTIFDRPMVAGGENEPPTVASTVGTIAFFGKQTDRPPRILMLLYNFPAYAERIAEVQQCLQLGKDVDPQPSGLRCSYGEFLARSRTIGQDASVGITPEQLGEIIVEEFLNLPIGCLGFQSPLDVMHDQSKRTILLGLLSHLEGLQALIIDAGSLDTIYSRLGLERPQVAVDPQSNSLRLNHVLDLVRIDIASLSPTQLRGFLQRAHSYGASRVTYECARTISQHPEMQDDAQVQAFALSCLLPLTQSFAQKLQLMEKLEAYMTELEVPVGQLILERLALMQYLGKTKEAQEMLLEAVSNHPEDPYLMSFLQYAMQQNSGGPGAADPLAGRLSAMSRPKQEQASSGLVLPGQSSAPAGGESKLWLPGS